MRYPHGENHCIVFNSTGQWPVDLCGTARPFTELKKKVGTDEHLFTFILDIFAVKYTAMNQNSFHGRSFRRNAIFVLHILQIFRKYSPDYFVYPGSFPGNGESLENKVEEIIYACDTT